MLGWLFSPRSSAKRHASSYDLGWPSFSLSPNLLSVSPVPRLMLYPLPWRFYTGSASVIRAAWIPSLGFSAVRVLLGCGLGLPSSFGSCDGGICTLRLFLFYGLFFSVAGVLLLLGCVSLRRGQRPLRPLGQHCTLRPRLLFMSFSLRYSWCLVAFFIQYSFLLLGLSCLFLLGPEFPFWRASFGPPLSIGAALGLVVPLAFFGAVFAVPWCLSYGLFCSLFCYVL